MCQTFNETKVMLLKYRLAKVYIILIVNKSGENTINSNTMLSSSHLLTLTQDINLANAGD